MQIHSHFESFVLPEDSAANEAILNNRIVHNGSTCKDSHGLLTLSAKPLQDDPVSNLDLTRPVELCRTAIRGWIVGPSQDPLVVANELVVEIV